jgi:hypothetical protein
MSRHRCRKGHLLPQKSTGYRIREPGGAMWWIAHERSDALMRAVPHVPGEAEMAEYWTCKCGAMVPADGPICTVAEWRKAQQMKEV